MVIRVTVEFCVDSGGATRGRPLTGLLDQVEAWQVYACEVEGHSPAHAAQAARWVRSWLQHSREHATPDACVAWLRDMVRGHALSPQTIRNRASACRRFCGWMVVQGLLDANPWASVPMPRGRTRQGADAFTDEQVAALIAQAERMAQQGRKPADRASAANRANLYKFLSLTGLRRGEARAQRWEDIDLQSRTMVVTHDKARRADPIPLSVAACGMLRQMLAGRGTGLVFPTIVTDKALEADCRACGITGRGKWHRFRVGFVTESFEAGVAPELIQRLARHRSIDQTHRYLRHREERLREAVEQRSEKSRNGCRPKPRAADRFPVDSDMAHGATITESTKTTSQVAAPFGSESTTHLAGLLSALGRSRVTVAPTNEKARVNRREPSVSRGDRICTDTPTDVGAERLIHAATLLLELAVLQMQQGAASDDARERGTIRSGGRGRGPRHSGAAKRRPRA